VVVLEKCQVGLSGWLSGRRSLRPRMERKGVEAPSSSSRSTRARRECGSARRKAGGIVAGSVGVATGQEKLKGERANARSVTPHCAHLPTRPTPKFELGSRPRPSSSTCPATRPCPSLSSSARRPRRVHTAYRPSSR
jgi:hypothetical protein